MEGNSFRKHQPFLPFTLKEVLAKVTSLCHFLETFTLIYWELQKYSIVNGNIVLTIYAKKLPLKQMFSIFTERKCVVNHRLRVNVN